MARINLSSELSSPGLGSFAHDNEAARKKRKEKKEKGTGMKARASIQKADLIYISIHIY
jgi:hypothetical protein